jgi:hypothetical protein
VSKIIVGDVEIVKPSKINPRVFGILCATSLAISIATPAMTVTPPAKSKTPIPTTVIAPTKTAAPTPTAPVNAPVYNPPATKTTNSLPLVAVPILTPAILKSFTNIYGEVLAVKFTPNQQQKIHQRLSKEWMTNLGLRNTVIQTIALEPKIQQGTPAERSQLQATLIGTLRQQVLDGDTDALWLVSFYDAVPKNWLAPGKPPLTQMTADMSADALCFMVNEVMGKSVATPDSKLKNAIATKLTAEYAKIPTDTKQELARLPTAWLKFKSTEWAQRGDDFREQMRIHWGRNLEAYIPELKTMSKLRRDRLAKLKTDPSIQWDRLNPIERQTALQKSELDFQASIRTLAPVKTVRVDNYINTMEVASSIGNSPTRYPLRLKIK